MAAASESSSKKVSFSSKIGNFFGTKKDADERQSFRVATVGYKPNLSPLINAHTPSPRVPAMPLPADRQDSTASMPNTPMPGMFSGGLAAYVREGSIRGSIFNLCSATLGAGALSLPFAFSKGGLISSTILLFLAAASTLLSISLLIRTAELTSLNSYELITVHLFGPRVASLVELCIIVFCFGTCVAYIVAIGDILDAGVIQVFHDSLPSYITREACMIIFWGTVMFPLSLFEKINSLRFSSLFGILSIFFLVFTTAYHSIDSLITNGFSKSWGLADVTLWPTSFNNIVAAMPIIMFAFTCQVNVFSIYDELEIKAPKRMERVSVGAVKTCVAAYLLMGVFGYLDFGGTTNSNILLNYCVSHTHNGLMISSFVCIVITIVMAFPLNIFPCRYTLEVVLWRWMESSKKKNKKKSKTGGEGESEGSENDVEKRLLDDVTSDSADDDQEELITTTMLPPSRTRHFLLTLLISGLSLITALKVKHISQVFQLMGGTASAFVCFVLPAAFAIKLGFTKNEPLTHAATWALAVGGAAVGTLSTVVTIYGMIYPEPDKEVSCTGVM
jgi:amino acid permease